jgi:hypothetical protein
MFSEIRFVEGFFYSLHLINQNLIVVLLLRGRFLEPDLGMEKVLFFLVGSEVFLLFFLHNLLFCKFFLFSDVLRPSY